MPVSQVVAQPTALQSRAWNHTRCVRREAAGPGEILSSRCAGGRHGTGDATLPARALEKAQQQLQEEVRQVSGQLLEERKKREAHEALARRLQKRVLLLTKERDGMRAILGSYDSELTQAEYSPQLTRRMREAEDMVQKVLAHSADMEVGLHCTRLPR
nr:mitotic spindle assembly checkpoint protein MAD1-like [Oryctolagus cuniculus]